MIRGARGSTALYSWAASDVYKGQVRDETDRVDSRRRRDRMAAAREDRQSETRDARSASTVAGPVPTSPANNDFKPGFATALMNKDLGLAMDAVASTGARAPLGTHAAQLYRGFGEQRADLDFSAIITSLH